MSTASSAEQPGADIRARKARHLEVCVRPGDRNVETGGAGFERFRLPHRALPELAWSDIDPRVSFLDRTIALPLFISCMTGGSEDGRRANRELALAAQQAGIPVGLGSHRVLLRHPEVFDHFYLRPLAPDVPILSNIGATLIRDVPHQDLFEINRRLEVDAQVIHLNPAQELFQDEGDRNFRGLKEALARFMEASPIPVIVKETGCGIGPEEVIELVGLGARYVDIAGHGGTSWILVEAARGTRQEWEAAQEFVRWGWPTAQVLAHLRGDPRLKDRLLASGGVRTAHDVAVALALGASAAGMALPFIRAAVEGGAEAVLELIDTLALNLRRILLLTGCRSPLDLARVHLYETMP